MIRRPPGVTRTVLLFPYATLCRSKAGAGLLIVPNGSPYWMDKQGQRYSIARSRVAETGLPLAYINQVGGQDELVFDGASFVVNRSEEHTSELQSLMRNSYAVFCLKTKKTNTKMRNHTLSQQQ